MVCSQGECRPLNPKLRSTAFANSNNAKICINICLAFSSLGTCHYVCFCHCYQFCRRTLYLLCFRNAETKSKCLGLAHPFAGKGWMLCKSWIVVMNKVSKLTKLLYIWIVLSFHLMSSPTLNSRLLVQWEELKLWCYWYLDDRFDDVFGVKTIFPLFFLEAANDLHHLAAVLRFLSWL